MSGVADVPARLRVEADSGFSRCNRIPLAVKQAGSLFRLASERPVL
jgi:hypothetical protein